MRDYRTYRPGSYQEMTSGFRWEVPASARTLTAGPRGARRPGGHEAQGAEGVGFTPG